MAKTVADILEMIRENDIKMVDFKMVDIKASTATSPFPQRISLKLL